jgi:hypothetical protein
VTTAAVESATVVGTATGTVGTVTATGGPTVVGTATRTVGTVATAVVSTTVVATAVVSLTGGGGTVAAVGAVFARLADGAGADTGAAVCVFVFRSKFHAYIVSLPSSFAYAKT